MATTLDQLLETTGIGELSGKGIKKTAGEEPAAFSKLAERCRRAATASPEEENRGKTQELVEKTAAVAVIARTLTEIENIVGEGEEKTAAPVDDPRVAEFINTSLNEGHRPEEIAEFLVKEGGRIGRFFSGLRAGRQVNKGGKLVAKGTELAQSGKRGYMSMAVDAASGSEAAKRSFLIKLRRSLPDNEAAIVMRESGVKGFDHLPEFKALKPHIEPPAKPFFSGELGGKKLEISSETANRVLKPAAMIGGGALAGKAIFGGNDSKKKSGKNIVVMGD
jgi:hypothetical protein